MASVLAAIFEEQVDSGFQILDTFLLRFTLAVCLGKLGAERYEPFTLAMNLSVIGNVMVRE